MQKKASNSEMVRDTAKDKCTTASNASSNFSSEEYRSVFEISGVAFRLVSHYGGLLVLLSLVYVAAVLFTANKIYTYIMLISNVK